MLFAGWEVRIVKSCDRGLENAARGVKFSPITNCCSKGRNVDRYRESDKN